MMAIESLLSRRNVVLGLAGTAAAGTVAVQKSGGADAFAKLLTPGDGGRTGVWLAKATSADWVLQVGTSFTAHSGHVLKLVNVQAFPKKGRRPASLRDRAFVARFDVVKGGKMASDAIYKVNHKQGAFDLFLSAGDPSRPLRMNAVFN